MSYNNKTFFFNRIPTLIYFQFHYFTIYLYGPQVNEHLNFVNVFSIFINLLKAYIFVECWFEILP